MELKSINQSSPRGSSVFQLSLSVHIFCNFNLVFSFPFILNHVHSCSFLKCYLPDTTQINQSMRRSVRIHWRSNVDGIKEEFHMKNVVRFSRTKKRKPRCPRETEVRMTCVGKYYISIYRPIPYLDSLKMLSCDFGYPFLLCRQSIVECTITNSIVTILVSLADGRMSLR